MPRISDFERTPRRELDIFYVLDTSEEMRGTPMATLYNAMTETVEVLRQQAKGNADALVKIAVLEFNSDCRWMHPKGLEEVEDFIWKDLKAGGARNIGAALKELDSKLSGRAWRDFGGGVTKGMYLPVFIFEISGYATDDYKEALAQINDNAWFKHGTKIGFAVGDEADVEMITEIVGTPEAVVQTDDLELFARLLRFRSAGEYWDSIFPTSKRLERDETMPQKNIPADSFQKALSEVISLSGKDILKNKNKLIAHLSDMAPDYRKEIHIFAKSCSPAFLQMFCLPDMENDTLRRQTTGRAREILLDNEGLSETWTNLVVSALEYALWGSTEP